KTHDRQQTRRDRARLYSVSLTRFLGREIRRIRRRRRSGPPRQGNGRIPLANSRRHVVGRKRGDIRRLVKGLRPGFEGRNEFANSINLRTLTVVFSLASSLFAIQARALWMNSTATLLSWVHLKERTPQYGRPVICSRKRDSRTKS